MEKNRVEEEVQCTKDVSAQSNTPIITSVSHTKAEALGEFEPDVDGGLRGQAVNNDALLDMDDSSVSRSRTPQDLQIDEDHPPHSLTESAGEILGQLETSTLIDRITRNSGETLAVDALSSVIPVGVSTRRSVRRKAVSTISRSRKLSGESSVTRSASSLSSRSSSKQPHEGEPTRKRRAPSTASSSDGPAAKSRLREVSPGFFPENSNINFEVGELVEVRGYQNDTWYPARFVAVDRNDGTVKVHFEFWNNKFDEWIQANSDRLRVATDADKKSAPASSEISYAPGQFVTARWGGHDMNWYPAKILDVTRNKSGTGDVYHVLFPDGFSKYFSGNLKGKLKPMPPAELETLDKENFGKTLTIRPQYPSGLFDPKIEQQMTGKRRSRGGQALSRSPGKSSATSEVPEVVGDIDTPSGRVKVEVLKSKATLQPLPKFQLKGRRRRIPHAVSVATVAKEDDVLTTAAMAESDNGPGAARGKRTSAKAAVSILKKARTVKRGNRATRLPLTGTKSTEVAALPGVPIDDAASRIVAGVVEEVGPSQPSSSRRQHGMETALAPGSQHRSVDDDIALHILAGVAAAVGPSQAMVIRKRLERNSGPFAKKEVKAEYDPLAGEEAASSRHKGVEASDNLPTDDEDRAVISLGTNNTSASTMSKVRRMAAGSEVRPRAAMRGSRTFPVSDRRKGRRIAKVAPQQHPQTELRSGRHKTPRIVLRAPPRELAKRYSTQRSPTRQARFGKVHLADETGDFVNAPTNISKAEGDNRPVKETVAPKSSTKLTFLLGDKLRRCVVKPRAPWLAPTFAGLIPKGVLDDGIQPSALSHGHYLLVQHERHVREHPFFQKRKASIGGAASVASTSKSADRELRSSTGGETKRRWFGRRRALNEPQLLEDALKEPVFAITTTQPVVRLPVVNVSDHGSSADATIKQLSSDKFNEAWTTDRPWLKYEDGMMFCDACRRISVNADESQIPLIAGVRAQFTAMLYSHESSSLHKKALTLYDATQSMSPQVGSSVVAPGALASGPSSAIRPGKPPRFSAAGRRIGRPPAGLTTVRQPELLQAKKLDAGARASFDEWLAGREHWLVLENGLLFCSLCRKYSGGKQSNWTHGGVDVRLAAQSRMHELSLTHRKAVKIYFRDVLLQSPPGPGPMGSESPRHVLPQNDYPCKHDGCSRTYRTQQLLDAHVRHFHLPPKQTSIVDSEILRRTDDNSVKSESLADGDGEDADIYEGQMVRCRCGENSDEAGFMVQCEECTTWQHGRCVGYDDEKDVPEQYVCYMCRNPPRLRDSKRFTKTTRRDYYALGTLPVLKQGRMRPVSELERRSAIILAANKTMQEVVHVHNYLRNVRLQVNVVEQDRQSGNTENTKQVEEIARVQDLLEKRLDQLEREVTEIESAWRQLYPGSSLDEELELDMRTSQKALERLDRLINLGSQRSA